MILANGCSHTHGIAHAVIKKYNNKLWPNIVGELIGDNDVLNLSKGGDSAQNIADSTIHWLETNTITPDIVIIQWTYSQRFDIPYHRRYGDDPFRGDAMGSGIAQHFPRTNPVKLTSTGIYLTADENNVLRRINSQLQHLGLGFPGMLFAAGFKQDVHPYNMETDDDPKIQELIDYYKRYTNYREAVCDLPTTLEFVNEAWARAQHHLAAYLDSRNIPYYWWGVDDWKKDTMSDFLYLKPKTGHHIGDKIPFIDFWLEKQGIMSNGDMIARLSEFDPTVPDAGDVIVTEENKHHITDKPLVYVDDHRGEDGHYYIGEMIANYILHGIQPDPNAEDREHCKKIMLERPNLLKGDYRKIDEINLESPMRDFKEYYMPNQVTIDPKFKELWRYATEPDYEYRQKAINPPKFFYE